MSLIEDIRDDIIDHRIPLSSIMRKARVLAKKLGNRAFEEWVRVESDGYFDASAAPDYRQHNTRSYGVFMNPAYRLDGEVPTHFLPKDRKRLTEEIELTQSIKTLEALLDPENSDLQNPWPGGLIDYYNKAAKLNFRLVSAHRAIPRMAVEHVLDAVRNRLLDFVMELEQQDPTCGEIPSVGRLDQQAISNIFNGCIMNNAGGDINQIRGNQGSNVATGRAKIDSSSAAYSGEGGLAAGLEGLKDHVDEVAEAQRQEFYDAIGLLVRALDDHTLSKGELIVAAEKVAGQSAGMKARLKALCRDVAGVQGRRRCQFYFQDVAGVSSIFRGVAGVSSIFRCPFGGSPVSGVAGVGAAGVSSIFRCRFGSSG